MGKSFQNKNDVSSSGFEETESEVSNQDLEKVSDIADIIQGCTNYKGLKTSKEINEPLYDTDDEELFLLRIPNYINPNILKNTKFSLNKKSKIKTNSGVYRVIPLSGEAKPQLFISSHGLKKISPVSTLQLENYVGKKTYADETAEEDMKKLLPNGLTDRHTVFGNKYTTKINLEQEIQMKLLQALQRFEEKETSHKKKKKHKAEVKNQEFEDKSLLISQIMEEKLKSKKISRTEKNVVEASNACKQSDIQPSTTSDEDVKEKKKSKKHKNKSKEIKQECVDSHQSISTEVISREKEKNKKQKMESVVIKHELEDSVFSQDLSAIFFGEG